MPVNIFCRVIANINFLDFFEHLTYVGSAHIWSLSPWWWSECVIEGLNLQKSFTYTCWLVECILYQIQRKFFISNQNRHSRSFTRLLLLKFSSIFLEFFLIDCTHITKPSSVWVDSSCIRISRSLLHFGDIWFSFVHVQPIDGLFSSELRAFLSSSWIWSIGIWTCCCLPDSWSLTSCFRGLCCNELLIVRFPCSICLRSSSFWHYKYTL